MIDSTYTYWDKLLPLINNELNSNYTEVGCHPLHKGVTRGGALPHSISEHEFNYMKRFILKHELKCGFELATGIGISTLAIGYALNENSGKLISFDSYIEEQVQQVPISPTQRQIESPEGFVNNKKLISFFNLNNVILEQGWSPDDCIQKITEVFSSKSELIDFVFLDCPKSNKDFDRDARYIQSFINKEKFSIFVHDTHSYDPVLFKEQALSYFGTVPKYITDFEFGDVTYHQNFPLCVITNIE